ncbi:MAG: hypothetical protein ACD_38C00102G0002 [uncultured bacterium]|uniref:Uncharacterized protein n=1 Tax=Candidatus Daviesbacteria bacterium RIFCSPHIGHO2_01_FULL_40_11 TaxID=1797762 RepID=A0A1F5JJD8_9BACT|nr:MAG: hypothetical protein ACD_38C00102G0002 [uncultured bacterium]OGE28735.1 MAG: hypothetical protein A2867_04610 [Candidatus Daviesbacteria bacterium RIFCSPHIGHO2_01_FULL_40_11]OGE62764.1 MAG: hypothetical protein A2964_00585 [Candidatus Daviesbacteria bacterium RIFCSPLOWO2_01_FULL_40_27]
MVEKSPNPKGFCAKGIEEIRGVLELVNYARDGIEARRLVLGALVESISMQEKILEYAVRLILRIHGPKF